MRLTATKRFTFEAAHYLEGYKGLCSNVHGHSYVLEVTVTGNLKRGDCNDQGMIMEFGDLKRLVAPIIDALDHSLICEHDAFNSKQFILGVRPTTENLAENIFRTILTSLRLQADGVELVKIRLQETATGWVEVLN